jgi:Glyoxalase/Bleomycin resistance protein/Dioxygenase superfamily
MEVLGFTEKRDLPAGEDRWLTVVSPAAPDGVELLLEPNSDPLSRTYQEAIYKAGIPATMFATDDIEKEYRRMTGRGVVFTAPIARSGDVTGAVFDDTCGNLVATAAATAAADRRPGGHAARAGSSLPWAPAGGVRLRRVLPDRQRPGLGGGGRVDLPRPPSRRHPLTAAHRGRC